MTAKNFRICSFNCNGLNNSKKRKDVFDFLRKKEAHIFCLQETHLTEKNENFIRASWGYNLWLSGSQTNKNGVAILFNNNFEYKMHEVIRDPNGCFIVMSMEILKMKLTLVNLYGPSSGDNPEFFDKVCEQITRVGNDNVIVTGDWNCALDMNLDVRNYARSENRPRTRRKISNIMTEHNLFDIFREMYPDKKRYTWRKFNSVKQARLDYFLATEELLTKTDNVIIEPGYRSDHSLVILCLKKEQFKRDRPFWKFNNSLLKDKKYVIEIKKLIIEVKKQYAIPVYDLDNISNVPNDQLTFVIDNRLFFETLMCEIRGKTISYATYKKKEENKREVSLERKIHKLELDTELREDEITTLEELKAQLEEIREAKIQGMAVRSKVRWIGQGEKVSRYFCNLENRNFLDKTIPFLEKDNGEIITDQQEILTEVKQFYEKLYSLQDVADLDISEEFINAPVLTNEESEGIEGEITFQEAAYSLKEMKNFKSPGPDGFTVEFFKFFFVDIGTFLVRSINEGFHKGQLSISQRQGNIICIPKEGKPKRFIKNWRPISLLNTVYKIASACIANRLKSIIQKITNESQKGFIKGRFIGEHIRQVYDTLVYTEKENIPGMLFTIDFEKAFDSVSWSFMQKCLHSFRFGSDMVKWIKLFYTDITTCIYMNGQYSSWFPLKRGVRQGDPSAPYLYLICAEILSLMIRNNVNIKGITIKGKQSILSQFADDTTLYLDGSEKSFKEAVATLSKFGLMSGLKINFEKSQVIWIGRNKNSDIRYMRDKNFVWDPGTFRILGINFSTDTESIVRINYDEKLFAMKRIMSFWKKRQITPFGKITVIKTLVFSKIIHLLISLPDPHDDFVKTLEKELISFLWNGKRSKIKKSIIFKQYSEGGLRMLNIRSFLSAMKLSWLKRLLMDSEWKEFTLNLYSELENLNKFGTDYANIVIKNISNPFWKDVMKHYKTLSHKCKPTSVHDFMAEHIHYNNNITRDNKVIFVKKWADHNILYVKQLLNDNGNFMNYGEFLIKFPDVRTNFILFQGILNAVRSYHRKLDVELTSRYKLLDNKTWFSIKRGNKFIQKVLNENTVIPTAVAKWNISFESLDWKQIFSFCHTVSQDTQLRWFQLRLLHRLLPTQRYLFLNNLVDSPLCNFCEQEEQNIPHMLYDCDAVNEFWNNLMQIVKDKCIHCHNFQLDKEIVLFGIKENVQTDQVMDLMILLAKFYIYKCKLQNCRPVIQAFFAILKNTFTLEQHLATISNTTCQFNESWFMYLPLVD